MDTNNPYLLLTPGPLSTTHSVKETMLRDWCTWDDDYNQGVVEPIRRRLESLASDKGDYTSVLMQGSGSFSVESVIGSCIPPSGKLLVLVNGAYGNRIVTMAKQLKIDVETIVVEETQYVAPQELECYLSGHPQVSHVATVHCETTTGILNPIEQYAEVIKRHNKVWIVDAMSSFGGINIDMGKLDIHFLISSANKCIQGVPGFGFVIAERSKLEDCKGLARSHSLDLYDQWKVMEDGKGKWRFTSPTHVVRAFQKALDELVLEGGITARSLRYKENHQTLVAGMKSLGFKCVIEDHKQSPFITTFLTPNNDQFDFNIFYEKLKTEGFVIYPGKVAKTPCFRIGHIGDVHPSDIQTLLDVIARNRYWLHNNETENTCA